MALPPEHQIERAREKAEAAEVIEHALAKIESEKGEPDLWERMCLRQAIEWLLRGGYRLASVNAALALTPQQERSSTFKVDDEPLLDRCDLATLRSTFQEVSREPLRDFPVFGPIVTR